MEARTQGLGIANEADQGGIPQDLLEIILAHLDWPSLVRVRTASKSLGLQSTTALRTHGVSCPMPSSQCSQDSIPPGVLNLIGTGFGTRSYTARGVAARVRLTNSQGEQSGEPAEIEAGSAVSPLLVLQHDPEELLMKRDAWNNPLVTFFDMERGHRIFMSLRQARDKPAWYSLDFGVHLTVLPYAFSLRHSSSQDRALRCFDIHGSLDGEHWQLLSRHESDSRLGTAQGSVATWLMNCEFQGPFRHFRVTKTGYDAADTHSSDYFHLSGMEIYGQLQLI